MAAQIVHTCDLDPTQNESVETVTFSDGENTYTVDLSVYAREALAKALAPFVAVATKVEPKSSEPKLAGLVREWAKKKGIEVSERGRVSKALTDQYLAEIEAAKAEKPASKSKSASK